MTDRSLLTVALLVLPVASAAAAEEVVWLSSLDVTKTVQEWGKPGVDRAVTGKPLSIAGQKFERGLGTHAQSRLRFKLTGNVLRFEASLIDRQVHFDLTRVAGTRIETAIASTFAERMQPLPIEHRHGKISCTVPRFSILTLTGAYAP